MKIAPIIHAIQKVKDEGIAIDYRLVHTGLMWSGKTGLEKSQIKPEITHPYETRTKKVHQ